ncbi:MAG: hypothetical protein WD491_08400 [Balneolales bacterium]
MRITKQNIHDHNKEEEKAHKASYIPLAEGLTDAGHDIDFLIRTIGSFQIAIPSWALGAGGTRFGRFSCGGEPGNLEEKISDVGLLHALNRSSEAISIHIPWDVPGDAAAIKSLAAEYDLRFDAVNSNTFEDQSNQEHSYKYGSLSHTDESVRRQAVDHNVEVIRQGITLGSKALTVWLADGSSFPGQHNFRKAFNRTLQSLQTIYSNLPDDWTMLVEYKPYEPNFYSMVIPDWGTSYMLASKLGAKANTLVDLGHHLPNTNIEQIVSILSMEKKLGGFHFNDSSYGDDDLTAGSVRPYQLFLIFNELIESASEFDQAGPDLAWMIDASHNIKDPLEDLLQSVEAIKMAYARALLIDRNKLEEARESNDPALAQEILQEAFNTDVRPLLREARIINNAAANPIKLFRDLKVREKLIEKRGTETVATGL